MAIATRLSWQVTITSLLLLLLWVTSSAAHMSMSEPPPINYKSNPYYNSAKGDFDYSAPLSPSGSNYPCKGHLKDLDAPEGRSVRTYSQGGTYDMVIDGSAVHGGGSCQAALSYDKGKSFNVIKSYIGNCPHATPGGDQTFKFTIPKNAPSGAAVFAWTWFNNIGNREMYMNCASVTIGGGGSRTKRERLDKRALSGPDIFRANIGNGCTTSAGTDVVFPNPGPVVEYGGNQAARAPPTGNCGSSGGSGGGSGGGGDSGSGGGANSGGGGTSDGSGGTGDDSGSGGSSGGETGGESAISSITSKKAGGTATPYPTYPPIDPTNMGGDGEVQSTMSYGSPTQVSDPSSQTNVDGAPDNSGGEGTRDCAYWRSQGYVCSDASPALLGKGAFLQIFISMLLFLWISL